MTNPCPHARSAAEFITTRAVMGVEKYGHTLADAGLSPAALVRHAREEAADLLVYLTALEASMVKPEPARPAVTRDAVTAIVIRGSSVCERSGGRCGDDDMCYCDRTIDAIMALIGGAP